MKITFFEVKEWEESFLRENLPGFEHNFVKATLNQTNFPNKDSSEIISIFTDSKIDASTLENFPNLKLIATRTTGVDHINQEATKTRGISVLNVPTYGENTVAEFTFALLLNLSRKISLAIQRIKEKGNFSSDGLQGFDLSGKTIGVVGTGHIGQHVIKIANGFSMNTIAFDARPNQDLANSLNFKYVSFSDLLKISDVVTLHIPYLPETHHLINQSNINLFKKGAILINTARGSIVETQAIVKALNEGLLGGVAFDVLEEETSLKNMKNLILERELDDQDLRTIIGNHVLIDMENVIITPHNAFNTKEALVRILSKTVENIKSFHNEGNVVQNT